MTSPARPAAWRVALVALASLTAPPAALVTGFFALIVWTGCFLSCETPHHGSGALLWTLCLALLAAGPVLAWWLLRTWRAVLASCAAGVVAVLLVVVSLTHS